MKKKKGDFFWIGYSDLMTSLFFIMLLLFVLSAASMYLKGVATENELKKIKTLQTAVNQLDKKYFEEDSINKRWVLKKQIQFDAGNAKIKPNDKPYLIEVGQSLLNLIARLNNMKTQQEYKDMDITYLIVIEGMASKDNYPDNDALSYGRALSLYYCWRNNGISFENSQCEVQIAGSGIRGIGRYNEDKSDPKEEYKNQRIIIQIIPKIGSFK